MKNSTPALAALALTVMLACVSCSGMPPASTQDAVQKPNATSAPLQTWDPAIGVWGFPQSLATSLRDTGALRLAGYSDGTTVWLQLVDPDNSQKDADDRVTLYWAPNPAPWGKWSSEKAGKIRIYADGRLVAEPPLPGVQAKMTFHQTSDGKTVAVTTWMVPIKPLALDTADKVAFDLGINSGVPEYRIPPQLVRSLVIPPAGTGMTPEIRWPN